MLNALFLCFLGVELPDSFSFFSVNGSNKFARFVADDWDTVQELLSLPDMMGGLQGLRPVLPLSPANQRCMRLCLMAVLEAVQIMQESCSEVNRGDVSALVSAYSEFTEVMGFLLSAFPLPSLFPPSSRSDLLTFDFTLIRSSPEYLSDHSHGPLFCLGASWI